DHAIVQVMRTAQGLQVQAVHRKNDVHDMLAEQSIPATDTVRLAVRARGYDYALLAGETTLAAVDGRELDASSTGGFLGLWFGVFATSHGAQARGSVRIDALDYTPVAAASAAASDRPIA